MMILNTTRIIEFWLWWKFWNDKSLICKHDDLGRMDADMNFERVSSLWLKKKKMLTTIDEERSFKSKVIEETKETTRENCGHSIKQDTLCTSGYCHGNTTFLFFFCSPVFICVWTAGLELKKVIAEFQRHCFLYSFYMFKFDSGRVLLPFPFVRRRN